MLRDLASMVRLSPAHLSALEAGKHPFSAALVSRLSAIFNVPIGSLIGEEIPRGTLVEDWKALFDILPERDQIVLVDLARKLTNWAKTFNVGLSRKDRGQPGLIVALEGIDGLLIQRLAQAIVVELGDRTPSIVASYDHQSELWSQLRRRFEDPTQSPIERTLLFACERLLRQESTIRPALQEDRVVLSPFFAMASSVYQEVDGVGDRRLIDIIDTQVLQPDLVVLVYSSPQQAARAATKGVPGDLQFFSPYGREYEFERALSLYRNKAKQEFASRGHHVIELELGEGTQKLEASAKTVAAEIRKNVSREPPI
ncbi:MAG: hypothetical protein KC431_20365 [Myxococcales bacterium]|nr:hypothetical protein [Myxococcales bacterium]MCA9699891.1 hypothetical protein [Myxococcales bacterium]